MAYQTINPNDEELIKSFPDRCPAGNPRLLSGILRFGGPHLPRYFSHSKWGHYMEAEFSSRDSFYTAGAC